MTVNRSLIIVVAPLLLAACAAMGPQADLVGDRPVVSLAEERGAQVAADICSGCHAIGPTGESPSAFAPPFRNIRLRYNTISLERHLADISRNGLSGMPPETLSPSDADALAAYIAHLRPGR